MRFFLAIILGICFFNSLLLGATLYSSEEEFVAATNATGPMRVGSGPSTGPLVVGDLSITPGECADRVSAGSKVSAEPMSCFDIDLALAVSVFGFTVDSWTGSSGWGDSTFEVRLLLDGVAVETLSFISPASGSVFFGFETVETFNRVEITEVIGGDSGQDRETLSRFFIVGSEIVIGDARYFVTDLGILDDGDRSEAFAVNNLGQVVGWSTTRPRGGSRAFLWEEGTMHVLESNGQRSKARDINDAGSIVGIIQGSQGRLTPVLWENNTLIEIAGGSQGAANGINQLRQVVGRADATNNGPFLWENDVLTTIEGFSTGMSINDYGQIVGFGNRNAFLWEEGVATDLGFLPGFDYFAQAFDINNMGYAVGFCDRQVCDPHRGDTSLSHAFVWFDGEFLDLGTLGGQQSRAEAISDIGQTVGWAEDSNNRRNAFLWEFGDMKELNLLIPENTGWRLDIATDINDLGQIVGSGQIFNGDKRAFLLTPTGNEPEPNMKPVFAMGQIQRAIEEKLQALETLRLAIIKEERAIDFLNDFSSSDDLGSLSQQELRQALQKVNVAITRENHGQKDIHESIEQLQKALDILNQ